MRTFNFAGAALKRVAVILLLTLGSWASFSVAYAQPNSSTWQFEPVLRILDDTGANELGAAGGTYSIPYTERASQVRLGFSVRVTRTAGKAEIQQFGAGSDRSAGTFGFANIQGTFVFEVDGVVATDADIARLMGTVNSSNLSAPPNYTDGATAAKSGGFSATPIGGGTRNSATDNAWNFAWTPDLGSTGTSVAGDLGYLRGVYCLHNGETSCEIPMGYLTFTPDLPPGGTLTVSVAGADGQGNMIVDEIQVVSVEVDHSVAPSAVGVTATQEHPAVELSFARVATDTYWILEGDAIPLRISTTAGEELLEDAVLTVVATQGEPGADTSDYSVPATVTMTVSSTEMLFDFMAVKDEFGEPTEWVQLHIELASGGAVVHGDSPTLGIGIRNLGDVGTTTPDVIPPSADPRGFNILPEGIVFVDNQLDDSIGISQAASGSPVILDVTDADGDSNPRIVGTRISIPSEVVMDDDDTTNIGLRLEVTLAGETDQTTAAASAGVPFGYVEGSEAELRMIDISMELDGGNAIADSVHVCLVPDASQGGDPALFRFDGTQWVATGESDLGGDNLTCGTTTEFSAFTLFYTSTASPDINNDKVVNSADALVLFYAYSLANALGNGR